jgi:hypothetical protein
VAGPRRVVAGVRARVGVPCHGCGDTTASGCTGPPVSTPQPLASPWDQWPTLASTIASAPPMVLWPYTLPASVLVDLTNEDADEDRYRPRVSV